jgi:protein-S-isoprenylcysteine O-methyltransferase Ste14
MSVARAAARAALRVLVHGALLMAPLAVLGRGEALLRPTVMGNALAMLALAEVESAARSAPDPVTMRGPGARLALVSALGLLATAWAALGSATAPFASEASSRWAFAFVIAVGIALRGAAIRALGAAFTSEIVAGPGHALVTRGVYRYVRHPSDLGLLLVAFGVAGLAASGPAALIALFVVVPSAALRVAREERVLATRHDAAHAAYRRSVSALGLALPLWRA